MPRRRVVGRPLLVVTAGVAAVAYACGSEVSGNLAAPFDAGDAGMDMNAAEVSGNLGAVDAPAPTDASADAEDGGELFRNRDVRRGRRAPVPQDAPRGRSDAVGHVRQVEALARGARRGPPRVDGGGVPGAPHGRRLLPLAPGDDGGARARRSHRPRIALSPRRDGPRRAFFFAPRMAMELGGGTELRHDPDAHGGLRGPPRCRRSCARRT